MAPARATGAMAAAAAIAIAVVSYCYSCKSKKRSNLNFFFSKKKKLEPRKGVVDAIGNTALIRINSLSDATGCEVSSRLQSRSLQDRIFYLIFFLSIVSLVHV